MAEGFKATKGNVEVFLKELKYILKTPNSILNIIPRIDKSIKYSTEYMLEIIILNIGTIVFSLLPYVGKRGEITRNKGLLFIVMYVIYLVYLVSSNI